MCCPWGAVLWVCKSVVITSEYKITAPLFINDHLFAFFALSNVLQRFVFKYTAIDDLIHIIYNFFRSPHGSLCLTSNLLAVVDMIILTDILQEKGIVGCKDFKVQRLQFIALAVPPCPCVEVKEKLKVAIEKNSILSLRTEQYTLGQWLDAWMENYAKLQVRASSYKTYQGFIENHIKPALGNVPLDKLTAMDLQKWNVPSPAIDRKASASRRCGTLTGRFPLP